jgi:hypothetical protein
MRQSDLASVNTKLIAAVQKYYKKTITLAGKTWSVADLVAALNHENQAIATAATTKEDWIKAANTVQTYGSTNDPLRLELRQAVLVQFGADAEVLHAFGYAVPRKRAPKTGQAIVAATEKSRATRIARNTLSKRQRKAVRGALTTPAAFAGSASQAAAPSATPATSTTAK